MHLERSSVAAWFFQQSGQSACHTHCFLHAQHSPLFGTRRARGIRYCQLTGHSGDSQGWWQSPVSERCLHHAQLSCACRDGNAVFMMCSQELWRCRPYWKPASAGTIQPCDWIKIAAFLLVESASLLAQPLQLLACLQCQCQPCACQRTLLPASPSPQQQRRIQLTKSCAHMMRCAQRLQRHKHLQHST